LGLNAGPVPARVDGRVKAGLLDLIEYATAAGWTTRAACEVLRVGEDRVARWQARRAVGRLDDQPPGGTPLHGLLGWERQAVVKLFEGWGDIDRSHRKLAHRGSHRPRLCQRIHGAACLGHRRPCPAGESAA
jgi:putative transposase